MSVIFLDGVSGTGKSTLANKTFDFSNYFEDMSSLREIHPNYCQHLYESRVILEIFEFLETVKPDDFVIADRSMFSAFAYNFLFNVGDIDNISIEDRNRIKKTWQLWKDFMDKRFKHLKLYYFWVLPNNVERVVEQLKVRGTFENTTYKKLTSYICNQSSVMMSLAIITEIDKLLPVQHFVTKEDLLDRLRSLNELQLADGLMKSLIDS